MRLGKSTLIERLFAEHGAALQTFFRRRIRVQPDAADLTQEVYLRMLRVSEAEVIRNPEAYLYTVASHLLKEHAVLERRRSQTLDVADPAVAADLAELPRFETQVDEVARVGRLKEVLAQLTPKCQAAVTLAYRKGLSYEEIGRELGVSANMVKKYLVQALAHCRKRMARLG